MHRYEELEKLYYKKRAFKIFFFFLIIVLIIVGIFWGIKVFNGKKSKNLKEHLTTKYKLKKTQKTKEKSKTIKKIATKKEKIEKKQPKLEFKSKKLNQNNVTNATLSFVLPDIQTLKTATSKNIKNKKPEKETKNKPLSPKKEIKKKTNIQKQNNSGVQFKIKTTSLNLYDLLNDFNANPSYDLAVMISKLYMQKGNLKEAQIWALKANNLNPKGVESWIEFADILLKEHKKQKALEVLNIYKQSYGDNPKIDNKIRSINGQ
jgi:predicted Zn-dependent protease